MTYFFDSVLANILAGVCAIIAFIVALGQVRSMLAPRHWPLVSAPINLPKYN